MDNWRKNKMAFSSTGMSNAEASFIFENSFGKMGIVEDQTYYNPMQNGAQETKQKLDSMKKSWSLNKAPSMNTTTGGTFTEYGLMPSFVDPSIVDRTIRETPLVGLLPRVAVRGRSYVYNIVSAKAGAAFLVDDAALNEQVDTRSVAQVTMKYLYAVGRVTGPAQRSAEGFINLLAEDIAVKVASMNEALENEILNGAVATDAAGFDGLRTAISTNSTSNATAAITLAQIRTDLNTMFEANGRCDLMVTDGSTHNVIKGLLMDFQRNIERPSGRMDFGIPDAFMFDGVLCIRDRYMPTTAAQHEILYLDTRYIKLAVLQDMTYQEMGKNNDSDKYYLKWYGALVVTAEALMAERTAIA